MKNYFILASFTWILFIACKEKKKSLDQEAPTQNEAPISALSIIRGQLNHLDTSLYQVIKTETIGNRRDSAFVKREDIKRFAEPFLSLPDIAGENYYDNYTEDKFVDAEQNTLNITSIAKNDSAEIQKQIMIISLSPTDNSKVQSIFIDRVIPKNDSTVEQKLFWVLDKYFSVRSIIEKENQPEKIHTTKVTWQ